jgi:hypothetical protein
MAATDGEGSGSRTGPALPDAIVSLIPPKPSLIRKKMGIFRILPTVKKMSFYVLSSSISGAGLPCSMPETSETPVLTMPFLEPGKEHRRPEK